MEVAKALIDLDKNNLRISDNQKGIESSFYFVTNIMYFFVFQQNSTIQLQNGLTKEIPR